MVNFVLLSGKLPLIYGDKPYSLLAIFLKEHHPWKEKYPYMERYKAQLRVPDPNTKLGPKGIKSIFVGYAQNSKAYRFLDLQSNVIVEWRDAKFFEDRLTKGILEHYNPPIENQYVPHKITFESSKRQSDDPIKPWRSQGVHKEKTLGSEFIS